MVRAGALRHRINLQSRATTVDAAGQAIGSWSTYRTCFAEVIYKGGAETVRGQQVDAQYSAVIRIRSHNPARFQYQNTVQFGTVKHLTSNRFSVEIHTNVNCGCFAWRMFDANANYTTS